MIINIGSKGGWPANVLSNFALTPFEVDDIRCASTEGFIQALKFPNPETQRHICLLVGRKAKFAGKKARKRLRREQKVWWQRKEFKFRSKEHFELIEKALRAKFTQNEVAKRALLATGDATLTHDLGPESPHTSLPAREFIRILNKIRQELLRESK